MLKKSLFYHHCDDTETFCEVHSQILLLKLNRLIAAVPTLNCTFSCKRNQDCKLRTSILRCASGPQEEAGSRPKDTLTAGLALPTWGG